MIDRIRLQVAGIVALANAILTLPTIVLMFVIGGNESQAAGLLVAALELIGAAMVTLLYSTLSALVREFGTDIRIWAFAFVLLMWLGLIPTAIGLALPEWKETTDFVGLPFIFLYGVAITGIGVKLLRSETSLFGLRVPVASLHICTGVSFLSLICMPLGILSSMVSDLVLCVLFFRAARPPSVA
jgi:hypothetical protein